MMQFHLDDGTEIEVSDEVFEQFIAIEKSLNPGSSLKKPSKMLKHLLSCEHPRTRRSKVLVYKNNGWKFFVEWNRTIPRLTRVDHSKYTIPIAVLCKQAEDEFDDVMETKFRGMHVSITEHAILRFVE